MHSLTEPYSFSTPTQAKAEPAERALSVASGALLMLPVFGKRTTLRWTAAAAGGALVYCGLSGTRLASRAATDGAAAAPKQLLKQCITIGKPAAEVHALWRNPDVLDKVRLPFQQLTQLGSDHLRWTMKLPAGSLEIEVLLVEDRPNELVHWRSTSESLIGVDERMRFRPAPQDLGTVTTLEYEIDFSRLPAGELLRSVSSYFRRAPQAALKKVLENFKSLAETGEVPTLERNPSARGGRCNGKGDWI